MKISAGGSGLGRATVSTNQHLSLSSVLSYGGCSVPTPFVKMLYFLHLLTYLYFELHD